MKRTAFILATLFFGIVIIRSQPLENSLLWKISGNGLEEPSYLYGTFHLLCPDDLVISDAALKAIRESDQVVLELDFDDPSIFTVLQAGMILPGGQTAKDYLDDDDYALVEEFFTTKMGLPFQQMAGIKPFFLSSMTLIHFLDCQPASPEMNFTSIAGEQEKEVVGLETVREQLGFIDAIPLEDAAKMLVMGIEDLDEMDAMTDEMIETYLKGDLESIRAITEEYMDEEYADLNKDLIVSRNIDWIPKIEQLISEKPSFIAFGAGHLPGEKGVIELLRKEGYTVKAMK